MRHLMSHTAGLSGWQEPMRGGRPLRLGEGDRRCSPRRRRGGSRAPRPATTRFTQGYLLGEVVRRVTGRTLGRFFAEEVAGPLGADFHIGVAARGRRARRQRDPAAASSRGADAEPGSIAAAQPEQPAARREPGRGPTPWRRAEIPAANGHGNARSIARIQAVVSHGGEAFGVRLLSPPTIGLIFREQCNGVDLVMGEPMRHGIGYGLANEMPPAPARRVLLGWVGRIVGAQRRRRPAHRGLRHEPHG